MNRQVMRDDADLGTVRAWEMSGGGLEDSGTGGVVLPSSRLHQG